MGRLVMGTLIDFSRLHPKTKKVYEEKPWARPMIEAVVAEDGEIVTCDAARPSGFNIGYRLQGTKDFKTVRVIQDKANLAITQMKTELRRSAANLTKPPSREESLSAAFGAKAQRVPQKPAIVQAFTSSL